MAATDKTRISKPSEIKENDQGQLVAKKGVSREVIEELSKIKGEPDWMRKKRLKSFEIFERKPIPTWGVDLSDLDLSELVLYSPPEAGRYDSWDDVPQEQRTPSRSSASRRRSASTSPASSACGARSPSTRASRRSTRTSGSSSAQWTRRSPSTGSSCASTLMNKCVPPQDNKFSALHGAVWSGGSFLYVPKDVKVDLPLQAYFRMEGSGGAASTRSLSPTKAQT